MLRAIDIAWSDAGARGISIALPIQSLDCTLQTDH